MYVREDRVNHCSGKTNVHRHHLRRFLGAAALTGALLAGAAHAADTPAKPVSGCVACHTDAEKLKAEAAKVPAPPASALQAGKG